ncbi:MAG TPA: hypothetical protein VEQ10_12620 [Vicinamibacteria bacterium]|nr:hypothetical protein [Vicinamibacteria bacterium]
MVVGRVKRMSSPSRASSETVAILRTTSWPGGTLPTLTVKTSALSSSRR